MQINIREAKTIITKSQLPNTDYVINPYTGCQHACIYCYAEFMIRFTGHKGEKWGSFLDVKQFDIDKIKPDRYNGKSILISSVTDPYQQAEAKYQKTRKILQKLIGTKAEISILTKSALVKRDIDLFKQFESIKVGISLSTLNKDLSRKLEPFTSSPKTRLNALKEIHDSSISTYLFISPLFPWITEYDQIINYSKAYVNLVMFENINFRPHNKHRIMTMIKNEYPDLIESYKSLMKSPIEWNSIEDSIKNYCKQNNVKAEIYFHHGGFKKNR